MMRAKSVLCLATLVACSGKTRESPPPDAKALCEVTAAREDVLLLRSKDRNAVARARTLRDEATRPPASKTQAIAELERLIPAGEATDTLTSLRGRRGNKIATWAGRAHERLAKFTAPSLGTVPEADLAAARKL